MVLTSSVSQENRRRCWIHGPFRRSHTRKLFFKIGEVCELAGVQAHVLRYWESEFPMLAPQKNRAGQRVYRKRDVEIALRIKELLYEDQYTIAGAKKRLANDLRAGGKLRVVSAEDGEEESDTNTFQHSLSEEVTVRVARDYNLKHHQRTTAGAARASRRNCARSWHCSIYPPTNTELRYGFFAEILGLAFAGRGAAW